MAISRRLRFEILRRDGHTCRYCGAMAPDVVLTVDHVIPSALGGSDDPSNLIAACQPCNAGKTSLAPDSPLVAEVEQTAVRWKQAMEQAAEWRAMERAALDEVIIRVNKAWLSWGFGNDQHVPRPPDWIASVERWLNLGLPVDDIERLIHVAMVSPKVSTDETWRYFCGCCWRSLTELQEIARLLVEADEESAAADPKRPG